MKVDREMLREATAENGSFSREVPGLQLFIDSTSLGVFKECPRKYLLANVFGYRTPETATDLVFGLLVHGARERYDHARAEGRDHDTSLNEAVMWVLRQTWDPVLRKPKWPQSPPVPEKTRFTCVRTVVWYLDHYGMKDNMENLILANGKPAIELTFQFQPGWRSLRGETYALCGHLDRVAKQNGHTFILDIKTTKMELGPQFFDKFKIDNQMALYDASGPVVLPEKPTGIIIDGIQVQVNGNRFHRHLLSRNDEQRNEWLDETRDWVGRMENSAEVGIWPANEKSCGLFRGCQFREVCGRSPGQRKGILETKFRREAWDPTRKRGDI